MKKGKNNLKLIIGFILGTVISSITATYAATVLSGNSVYYDNTKSGGSSSNVSGALDELYAVANDQDALKASILDLVYPVGSVYISTTDATVSDVEKRFGGSWEKYSQGRTLIGEGSNGTSTYTIGKVGGSESHNHISPLANAVDDNGNWYVGWTSAESFVGGNDFPFWGSSLSIFNENISSGSQKHGFRTGNSSNLSPYIVTYMYKRIA